MEFGKVKNRALLSKLDFSPAPTSAASRARVQQRPRLGDPKIYVGAPIWSQPDWVGPAFPFIYPVGSKPKDFLWHYARHFDSIELNVSFYRMPDTKTVSRWVEETAEGFRFCPKVYQGISNPGVAERTHGARDLASELENLTDEFARQVRGLGERLGLPFLQLPPQFAAKDAPRLQRFLARWPQDLPLAVEFRHPSWFRLSGDSRELSDAAVAALSVNRTRPISTVITDTADRRDVAHGTLTSRELMVRFLGNSEGNPGEDNLEPTDLSRLEAWAQTFATWIDAGVERIYFCIHDPGNLRCPELTRHFKTYASEQLGLPLASPATASTTPPSNRDGQLGFF